MAKKPEKAIEIVAKRMLPKNSLGRAMFRKLKVYRGSEHPHEAQKPGSIRNKYLILEGRYSFFLCQKYSIMVPEEEKNQ